MKTDRPKQEPRECKWCFEKYGIPKGGLFGEYFNCNVGKKLTMNCYVSCPDFTSKRKHSQL